MSADFPLPYTEAINDMAGDLAAKNAISLDEAARLITNAVLGWGASVAETIRSIDWQALSDTVNAINTYRPQRICPVSPARVRRALKHLPASVVEKYTA